MTLKCYGYQLCVRDLFSNTSRYIDDLLTLHDPDFQAHICQIYLSELEFLKKKDRVMMAVIGKFSTDLHDKRDGCL